MTQEKTVIIDVKTAAQQVRLTQDATAYRLVFARFGSRCELTVQPDGYCFVVGVGHDRDGIVHGKELLKTTQKIIGHLLEAGHELLTALQLGTTALIQAVGLPYDILANHNSAGGLQ